MVGMFFAEPSRRESEAEELETGSCRVHVRSGVDESQELCKSAAVHVGE